MDAQPPIKVLLVDDSRAIRHSARQILEEAGCQITLAEDGFDALCRVAALRPDIIFMDIMMPDLDGFQACALIRASPEFGAIPVVLVSANDGVLDRARAELAGARRYILKPFRKSDLLEAIKALARPGKEEGRGSHSAH
ncbi:MAG: response regulator [Pseudohongiellaceae bacterium]